MTTTRRTVSYLSDMPSADHWAIVEFHTIYVPGDERSRQYPGHGYPESNEPIARYVAYTNYLEWETEVTKRTARGDKDFAAIGVKRATITTKVQVGVDFKP